MSRELQGWQRYFVIGGGVVVAALICYQAWRFTISPHGSIGPTMFQSESPWMAAAATTILFAIAAAVAVAVGRVVNAAVGLFVLGAGLWALRLRLGTAEDLAFGGGSLGQLAVETLFWAVLVLGAVVAMFAVAGPLEEITPEPGHEKPAQWWDELGLKGAAAGILILPAVWLIARSDLRGQTLAAVVLGAMVVGLVGRMLSPQAQPRLLYVAPLVFGAIGQLIAAMMVKVPLADAYVARTIPAVGLPMPIDYAAGSLMGVSMGLGWAKSFLHQDEAAAEAT